eukprot:1142927-Pelagomonas_calceolata.AAC.1
MEVWTSVAQTTAGVPCLSRMEVKVFCTRRMGMYTEANSMNTAFLVKAPCPTPMVTALSYAIQPTVTGGLYAHACHMVTGGCYANGDS